LKAITYVFLFLLFLLVSPACPQAEKELDRPVEAWIVYKQEGSKVIEVIKVKTASGKVYELYPHLPKEKIPKPENRLSKKAYEGIFWIALSLLVGLVVGIGVTLYKIKKEGP
jgi:hypothetical protein